MTTTFESDRPAAEPAVKPPVKKSRWSKTRLITPYAVVAVLVILTIIAVSAETPDPTDAEYLSPTATGEYGGSTLAARLAAKGVDIDVVQNPDDAIDHSDAAGTTLFIPAPDFLRIDQLFDLEQLPPDTRIVLVRPGALRLSHLTGLEITDTRIVTGLADPEECNVPEAVPAEPAEVFHDRYGMPDAADGTTRELPGPSCYDGSLVTIPTGGGLPAMTVVGAPEPFDNARIDAAGNSELAVGLLSATTHLVWLDQHATQPLPKPTGGHGEQEPYDPPDVSSPDNPLYKVFPTWMWATLIGILVVFILAALARGRRLGPPTVEPLAVQVPAAETVYGRARLYRRGASREAAMRAMREGALHRLLPAVGLSSKAEEREIVETIAARSGNTPQHVHTVLYGPPPVSDQDLLNSIHALDSLEYAILGERYHERHQT